MNFDIFIVKLTLLWSLLLILHVVARFSIKENSLNYLEPGDKVENTVPGLHIFCHTAKTKYFIYTWRTLIMSLDTNLDRYDLYDGQTPAEVMEKHDVNRRSWIFNWFSTKKSTTFQVNPFEDTCIGVYTYPNNNYRYNMSMSLIKFDIWKVATTIAGMVIFLIAPKLSRNTLFYYITGIFVGITCSILILIWFTAKLFGQGKTMYFAIGTGWMMSTWLARILLENAQLILLEYREYVVCYFFISSLISFFVCYRIGPVTNARTKKIIQWFLQIVGMTTIYFSSHFKEATLGLCVLMFFIYNFPTVAIHRSKSYWRRIFPKREKFLTDNEYRIQSIKETQKALGGLRDYCSSPESNPWKTILRLKDPIRFAKFMEGESHVSDDESMMHDLNITRLINEEDCQYTDDECSDDN